MIKAIVINAITLVLVGNANNTFLTTVCKYQLTEGALSKIASEVGYVNLTFPTFAGRAAAPASGPGRGPGSGPTRPTGGGRAAVAAAPHRTTTTPGTEKIPTKKSTMAAVTVMAVEMAVAVKGTRRTGERRQSPERNDEPDKFSKPP